MAIKTREIKSILDAEAGTLTIQTEGKPDLVVDISNMNREIKTYAMLHGLKQKIVDSAALGAGYTLTEKYAAMQEVVERLTGETPTWNKRGEGAGTVTGLLYRALCRLYPDKDPAVLREYHDKLDKSKQAALRKNPKVAAIIEEIKSESVKTAGIDTSELLDELDAI